ncbi:MAG: succinylglutamate-semialdehyde dehydrogenase [Alphaproteobacteria bacterium]|nr:MAG: succinylglutamate-semialdehyde dehydrogenase [Alphaproteobacteria bacterium]TAF16071.1 MAG: succinylglutamate-semialdehyde dehydrogenase [Alphaproteobacteria bacterium]TAF40170.1 MAG: succinylglutamate-semialdehyde dehydrogenase [Alphaproteobacteria bacterium]TAF75921.1 MAG: succinylglutamate-semialdehyde dehydrogenase [Alphaproteobacteria bacterium]
MTILSSYNPATGDEIWRGDETPLSAMNDIVDRARTAFTPWSHTTLDERIELLQRYAERVKARREEIEHLIAKENGKVLRDAKAEAGVMISKVAISIEAYHQRTGETNSTMDGGIQRRVTHRPIGVMAVFGPYNFPMHLPNGHIVPALLAGNVVILKPSEQTPACGALIVELFHEAGFPTDVVQCVQGGRAQGEALVQHPSISGVLFTGSYATGKAIHKALSGRPEVMLALEMGGNNPLIAHHADDAYKAAQLIVESAFASSGQRCTCARRLIVPVGAQGDKVIAALQDVTGRLTVGDAFATPEPYMAALINNTQADAVLNAQEALIARGAKLLHKAERTIADRPFLTAGLLDVTGIDGIEDEEVFGPLLQIIRVADGEEAVRVANATAYGLSAGVITDDDAYWDYAYRHLRAGILNRNRPTTGAASSSPFGGPGHSGNYRPSAYYAADYCAYPVATLATDAVEGCPLIGLST